MEEEKIESQPVGNNIKGSYFIGIIGAIVGALIASIPWIITYAFANMIVAYMATIIAGGAFYGYKIFKGKIGKSLPIIIVAISLVTVILVTLVICPMILLAREGLDPTFSNLQKLYNIEDVKYAIIKDLIISLLFTAVGITVVVRSIKLQIKNGVDSKDIKFNTQAISEELKKQILEQCEVVKKACLGLNATSEETEVTKQEVLNELEMTYNVERRKCNQYFNSCISTGLIKKHKGKYYYDETDEQTKLENIGTVASKPKSSKTATIILNIFAILIILLFVASSLSTETYTLTGTDIEVKVSKNQKLYTLTTEIAEIVGTENASDYDFIIKGKNNVYYLYGTLLNKADYEQIDMSTLINYDRAYIASYYGEDVVTNVTDMKFGNRDFKTYSYKYETKDALENSIEELAVMYMCQTDEKYIFLSVYASDKYNVEEVNKIIKNLFE